MTPPTAETSYRIYARVAGFTFLFYIATGITSLALAGRTNVTNVLALLTSLSALVLGVTLYMITREQGPALAILALTCRVLEAVSAESAIFFAVGSMLFCWLLLRGRLIPMALAWLGVLASVLLVGPTNWSASVTWLVWLPMLVFEVVLALWLLIKGVNVDQWQKRTLESASAHV